MEIMSPNQSSAVGNIYLGKVTKVLPGMDAVFVDYGEQKMDCYTVMIFQPFSLQIIKVERLVNIFVRERNCLFK